ncbi:hypothetical protein JCM8547_002481 [Rhodosporidiobolus lusitaniae]
MELITRSYGMGKMRRKRAVEKMKKSKDGSTDSEVVSTLLNKPYDAFADEGADEEVVEDVKKAKQADHIHIRIQQRNGRKTITTLQGVPTEYDPKKLLKAFKKEFACNGSIVEHEEMGKVIQLQGDQRQNIFNILIEEGLDKDTIKVHGF